MIDNEKIHLKRLELYGGLAYFDMLIEECGNTTKTIARFKNDRTSENDLFESLAKLEIMIEGIKLYFDEHKKVDDIKNEKLKELDKFLFSDEL